MAEEKEVALRLVHPGVPISDFYSTKDKRRSDSNRRDPAGGRTRDPLAQCRACGSFSYDKRTRRCINNCRMRQQGQRQQGYQRQQVYDDRRDGGYRGDRGRDHGRDARGGPMPGRDRFRRDW